jgi:hypothetical protein
MALGDWIATFSRAQSLDLSSDLERGYEAALQIQSIELEHYNDRPVRPELELRIPRQLQAQVLRRFKAASLVCQHALQTIAPHRQELSGQELRQLQLIESVMERYDPRRAPLPTLSRAPEVLPRSLTGVIDQVRRQLDPDAEASVVAGFRRRRDSTLVSLRILLLLILVPVLLQQASRSYLISPIVDHFTAGKPVPGFSRPHLDERAVEKLRAFKAEIEFEALLEQQKLPDPEELRQRLAEKAKDLKQESTQEGTHAFKNILADLAGFIGFVLVCLFGQRDIQVLRGFLDEVVYGLSDSAKAFAIILATDIFVGFHSPEGWTVLLDGIAHHLGLPARENFIMLFIATFPVVLATIFKYWIFRYLNRVSPSSVATLHNMNGGG